ncbi:MAG TPA: hypothetical protein VIW24_22135 [Aldersonia sp.]
MSKWTVDVSLVEEWLIALDQSSYEQVVAALELLGERGPADDRFDAHLDGLRG